jgi:hypothetical protein
MYQLLKAFPSLLWILLPAIIGWKLSFLRLKGLALFHWHVGKKTPCPSSGKFTVCQGSAYKNPRKGGGYAF